MTTEDTVQAYLDAWNEADETKRRELIDRVWTDKGTYTDPMSHVEGKEELNALIEQFHSQMPGAKIAIASKIDQHHGRLRFAWRMEGGQQSIDGIDIGRLSDDGKIESIVGFFGASPPPA